VGTIVLCLNPGPVAVKPFVPASAPGGGGMRTFSEHPIRYASGVRDAPQRRHMQFAWMSLIVVGLTDLYVRWVPAEHHDFKLFIDHDTTDQETRSMMRSKVTRCRDRVTITT